MTADASTALLRRLERGALIWTLLAVGVVLVTAPSRTDVMLGVAGGGLLSLGSYYAIRASVDAVMLAVRVPPPAAAPPLNGAPKSPPDGAPNGTTDLAARPGRAGVIVKLTGRYALLGLMAYVMIARLRLHPLGLLVGLTALPASATAEAVRGLGRPGRAS